MPAKLDIDRDQARMLCMELGYAEASRRTGVPHATLRQWGSRGKWTVREPLPPTMRPVPVVTVTGVTVSPADALAQAIADDERATRVSLSRGTRRAAYKLEDCEPDQAGDLHMVAKTYALVHRIESDRGPTVAVNIAILSQADGDLARRV